MKTGVKKFNKSGHTATTHFAIMNSNRRNAPTVIFATIVFLLYLPASEASTACSFNGNGACTVSTDTDANLELLATSNHSVNWKIRPQNIGFMYYLRTSEDGNDLGVRGIVKWKVHLKNWTPNDTVLEGFLVTIMEHDTNETVTSYELTMSEPFEQFVEHSDVLEMRMELDDVLGFDKRYDAKINILPIGKQAPAASFLSVMGKLEGEECSAMTGLAERWAPHVMVDVFETTSEIELSWKPAPSFLCIKTYEVTLQNSDGLILNTTDIEVTPGQMMANASFGKIAKDQMIQVKVRGKNSIDGGCACVNCNCITDKTKYFIIPEITRQSTIEPTTHTVYHDETNISPIKILLFLVGISFAIVLIVILCLCCKKVDRKIWKQKIALNSMKSANFPMRKTKEKKIFNIMLVCPEIEGRERDLMMRIADAMRKSRNNVVCDRWNEHSAEVEENILHFVYKQTQIADRIVIFHAASPRSINCGTYDIISNYFPSTDSRLQHIALSAEAQRSMPREVEYVMPRDQKLLEEAYDLNIVDPLVIDIPNEAQDGTVNDVGSNSMDVHSATASKVHSTDSGVSSLSCNSSNSQEALSDTGDSPIQISREQVQIEKHPLLYQPIPV